MPSQLARLAKPFPDALIHENPSGAGRGDYVSHSAVTEKLLAVVGPFSYEIVEIIRGEVKGKPELGQVVVGCLAKLTVMFADIDRLVSVTEVGDCERPDNWPNDGARLKDASSDAIKRCAMRLSVGLHLWSQKEFFLDKMLEKLEGGSPDMTPTPLTPDQVIDAVKNAGYDEAQEWGPRTEILAYAGLVVVEATGLDTERVPWHEATGRRVPSGQTIVQVSAWNSGSQGYYLHDKGGTQYEVSGGEITVLTNKATGPDTTPISDVVRDGADKSSRETADSCRSMENGTPLTCELPAGHHGPHSFDPSPEGLVPDPREPGCWLGRLEDVPWPGWQVQLNGTWVERSATAYPDGALVRARPVPQPEGPPPPQAVIAQYLQNSPEESDWSDYDHAEGLASGLVYALTLNGYGIVRDPHAQAAVAPAQVADALNAVDAP